MVRVHTVEMLEHSSHSTPYIKAHTDLPNGAIVSIGSGDVTAAPATGKELYVVMNEQTGDDVYAEAYTISEGDFVNLYKLSNWVGKELDITESNITYASGKSFADISVGTVLTFDASTFKFAVGAGAAGDLVYTVTKKFGASTNGVIAQISVKA